MKRFIWVVERSTVFPEKSLVSVQTFSNKKQAVAMSNRWRAAGYRTRVVKYSPEDQKEVKP